MAKIHEIFDEYDTGIVCVSDFDIKVNGTRVDYITHHVDPDKIGIWAGDPVYDKHAEELIVSKEERNRIFNEIMKYI